MSPKTPSPLIATLFFLSASSPISAFYLYASSYAGTVTTLNVTAIRPPCVAGPVPELQAVATSDGCAGSPSWLTLDHPNAVLYCVDEGLSTYPDGSLSSYATNADGSLTQLDKVSTSFGPVNAVVYDDARGLAMPHYGGSVLTAWNITDPSSLAKIQTTTFTLDGPGTIPSRQEAAHPHEAVLDPTGNFIVVPDLGADLIRLFAPDAGTLKLQALDPVSVKPGSGPRHLGFAVKGDKTFMYLATELANTIIGFEVTYPEDSIHLEELFTIGAHGEGETSPAGSSASEVVVSPDSSFVVVSSRDENSLTIPSFDTNNGTSIPSDPLITFAIDADTGSLTKIQEAPCGGRGPRQFSMNKAGTLVAVGLQTDGRVALIARNVKTGKLGRFVGYANVEGQVTSVIFDE